MEERAGMTESMEAETPVPVTRRTRPFPSWMGLVTDSTAWLITLTVLTVSRYLLADVEVSAAWGNVLRNVGLLTLLSLIHI